jgi:hypothetical protein
MRSGAKCSVTGKILAERNDSRCADEGSFTFPRREAHVLRQWYQYCWFCRTTPMTQPFSVIFFNRLERITPAEYRKPLKNPNGLQVWTAKQSGQRNRFTHKHLPNPSKYRAANPCPHNLALPHWGHRKGINHGNFFPLSNKTFTSTARCSIKIPLSERATNGNGGQTNQPSVALFLYDQISLKKTLSHTKHRDKKIPPSVNLMCEVTMSTCERRPTCRRMSITGRSGKWPWI